MLISEAKIKEILDKADIVSIIGEFIHLEKKGNDYKGICPFHDDSNPSLSVSPARKIYKCFSCGASGNAISFVQNFKHISFVEAVKYVGEKCGVKVETTNNYVNKNQKLYSAMEDATNYYEFYLKSSKEGKSALEYLNNRHLDDEIIKRFRIGLASIEENLLFDVLTKRENPYLPIDLMKCGLIRSVNGNKYVDTFRNRIIFPITNLEGQVVGFSGRIYNRNKDDDNPKYVNTSENEIFKKGNILYNYSYSSNDIKNKNRIYIFEGFMDVIAAYRSKVYNTVATMGTALTNDHIKSIRKLTNNIVLCFDGDSAGINATIRSIKIFVSNNMDVKVLLLPEGLDPDEYLEKYGEESLHNLLENGPISSFDYLYSLELRNLNKDDLDSVNRFKNNIFSYVSLLNSKVVEDKVFDMLEKELNIDKSALTADFNTFVSSKKTSEKNDDTLDFVSDFKKIKSKKAIKKTKYINSEQSMIYFSLMKKEYCKKVASLLPFDQNIYVDKLNRDVFWAIYDYYRINNEMDYEKFYNSLMVTDNMRKRLDQIILFPALCEDNMVIDFLTECSRNIRKYSGEKKMQDLRSTSDKSIEDLEKLANIKKQTTQFKKNLEEN